jgi:hypothetical protein
MRMGVLGYPRISQGIPGYQVNIFSYLDIPGYPRIYGNNTT